MKNTLLNNYWVKRTIGMKSYTILEIILLENTHQNILAIIKQHTEKNLKILNAFQFVLGYKLPAITEKDSKIQQPKLETFLFPVPVWGTRRGVCHKIIQGPGWLYPSFHVASISGLT